MKTCNCCNGILPSDWEILSLLDVSSDKPMYGINAAASELREGAPRYLRITDIDLDGRLLHSDPKGVDSDDVENFILRKGDIVFARTGNTTGKSFHYNEVYGDLIFAGFLIKFNINPNCADSKFVYYCTQTDSYYNWVASMSQRSGQPGINSKEYSALTIPVPPIPEQKKIAKILSTVDGHIDEVDGMIEDLKELKKGLMQKLLTEGIGHTEFKDSEVGRIPVEWEVKTLKSVSVDMYQGINTVTEKVQYMDSGYPILQAKHITDEKVDLNDTRYLGQKDYDKYSEKYTPKKTDLLVSNIGTIGKVVHIDTNQNILIAWNIFLIRVADIINSEYLAYYLRRLESVNYYDSLTTGNATKFVNKKEMQKINIKVPPISEQEKIVDILKAVDVRIDEYSLERSDILQLKNGLMQQLLTGKTRVQIDN